MNYTLSPNMMLRIPAIGAEAGPDYAIDINLDLATIIDTHDHTSGKGVQITTSGLNINSPLTFNNNFGINLAGLTLTPQGSSPSLNTIYQSGSDLYFVDGVGNNIRITASGGIAGSPGSITNLTAPAAATYVSGSSTFVFQSNTNIAANVDAGAYLFRNLSPNSTFAVTLQAPAALSSNYSLTLPALPSVQSFMTLDNAGVISAPWTVDNSSIKIISNQLTAQGDNSTIINSGSGLTVRNGSREHNWELNGPYPVLSYPLSNIDAVFLVPYNMMITSVWIYNGTAGGGGTTEFDLKVANPGGAFTSILSTTGKITSAAAGTIWTDSDSVIPPQTGVTKPVLGTTTFTAGKIIVWDLLQSMTGAATDARIRIYYTQV